VKKGDRVTGDCSRFCGTCEYCRSDKNVCEHIEEFGITIDGASAETILRKEKYIYRLPKSLDFSLGSLVEPLAVSPTFSLGSPKSKRTSPTSEFLSRRRGHRPGGFPSTAISIRMWRRHRTRDIRL
jgi:hypothetical protein